ncbi:hypothetical protein C731_0473 [Mycolicibacterium hassiacum DSM 44199]|uniref:Uncharacterized protein n=1 Tax=Mycolicibacterium hassiacum (strain DSM 44199 / CIP 105218 / JCM 12690 / 3849) TaxID=1122247 RepID=K5BKV3_MYCHD|nr:hypothetical protein C731_0473 [Mycolicibacterium hassiacum DSM 44199]
MNSVVRQSHSHVTPLFLVTADNRPPSGFGGVIATSLVKRRI